MTTHEKEWVTKAVQFFVTIFGTVLAGGIMLFMTTAYASMVRTEARLSTLEANYKNIETNTGQMNDQLRTLLKVSIYKAYNIPYKDVKDELGNVSVT